MTLEALTPRSLSTLESLESIERRFSLDRRNRNLAIVANRTRENTISYRMLMRFLRSLEIPIIAQLRDSQNFVRAAAQGIGIYELPGYLAKKDIERMDPIIEWLDSRRSRPR